MLQRDLSRVLYGNQILVSNFTLFHILWLVLKTPEFVFAFWLASLCEGSLTTWGSTCVSCQLGLWIFPVLFPLLMLYFIFLCALFLHFNPLHTNISMHTLHTFSILFLRFLKGEFVEQSRGSLVVDHYPYSHDLNVLFRADIAGRK